MKQTEDISILVTDTDFQKLLSEWPDFDELKKAEVCKEYELALKDVEILRQLWLGLDFSTFEQPSHVIEESLEETIWKIAERKNPVLGRQPVKLFFDKFSRIAAILIIPILLYTVYIQLHGPKLPGSEIIPEIITVNSQPGTVSNLVLPDGSRVYLNSGSSVSYPGFFHGTTREVSVTGEAYFEVVKNKELPMVVSVADSDVKLKVYGTTFNVNAFPEENFMKVTLVEGSVALSSEREKFGENDEFLIKPGQTVSYNADTKELKVDKEDPFLFTAWKDGLLIFRNKPFESVLVQLSRKFNVDIELKDNALARIPMDATFKDENVNEILRLLAISTPFKFYYAPSQKLPDGTFARSKIYIEKN